MEKLLAFRVHLHGIGVQNGVIPLSDSPTVLLEDKANNLIAYYHRNFRNWSAKSAHQIAKSAWVGKSLQYFYKHAADCTLVARYLFK